MAVRWKLQGRVPAKMRPWFSLPLSPLVRNQPAGLKLRDIYMHMQLVFAFKKLYYLLALPV